MSKAERARIKVRVRTAMASQAETEGRFLAGRPPYGYFLADAGPHPNPAKAALGQRLRRLERDPTAAPVVERIFSEYIAGAGIGSIAEGLNRDRIPSPSGHDPERNRHRAGARGAWGKSAVRSILGNPRYIGRQVWNRQRRDEELVDVNDVGAGYETRMRWNDSSEWKCSKEQTHEAIISPETFAAASAQRSVGHHRKAVVKPRRKHTYCLSTLVFCGTCGRRMSGVWNHDEAYYRCHFPAEYEGAKGIEHPRTVYLHEADLTSRLDEWLLSVFDPKNLDATVAALVEAQEPDEAAVARAEAAHRTLADCESRLTKYRSALEAGADPAVVTGWIKEVETDRLFAERELSSTTEAAAPLSMGEIRALVASQRKVLRPLSKATPEQRATIYNHTMGLRIVYHPERATVDVEARPTTADACTQVRVGGGT